MAREIPWCTAEELAKVLEQERDALTRQIDALRETKDAATPEGRATVVLCEYLFTGSSADAAMWARDMGWKAVSRKTGGPCEYTGQEVVAMIEDPTTPVNPELRALCLRLLRRQRPRSAG